MALQTTGPTMKLATTQNKRLSGQSTQQPAAHTPLTLIIAVLPVLEA